MGAESFQFDREMRVTYSHLGAGDVVTDVVVDGQVVMRAGIFIPKPVAGENSVRNMNLKRSSR